MGVNTPTSLPTFRPMVKGHGLGGAQCDLKMYRSFLGYVGMETTLGVV